MRSRPEPWQAVQARMQQGDVLVVFGLEPEEQPVKGLQVHWRRGRVFQVRHCFE